MDSDLFAVLDSDQMASIDPDVVATTDSAGAMAINSARVELASWDVAWELTAESDGIPGYYQRSTQIRRWGSTRIEWRHSARAEFRWTGM